MLLSVVEGDDKPFKYPAIFSRAAVTLITKVGPPAARGLRRRGRPPAGRDAESTGGFLVTSARSGDGMDYWFALLEEAICKKHAVAPARAGS